MTLTPIRFFKSDNIDELNVALWNAIYSKGNDLHFGGTEGTKDAKEIFAVMQVYQKLLMIYTMVNSLKAGNLVKPLIKII